MANHSEGIKKTEAFSNEELRWKHIPVAIAVDIDPKACQIDPAIRPLRPPDQQPPLFGRAVTAACKPPDFGAVLHALDLIGPGNVLVIAAGGHRDTAMIGEILSGHVRRRGGAGVICDGAVRDVGEIAGWDDFSVYSRFVTPRGPTSLERGAINLPVQFGGQEISPGDLIIGDNDGLVRLTPSQVTGMIDDAEAKLKLEAEWISKLEDNTPVETLFDLSPLVP